MSYRFVVLGGIVSIAYAGLLFRLYDIQLVRGGYFVARAESQYLASEALKARRGQIYFLDKTASRIAVATTKNFPLIYADPKAIEDPRETANRIAPLLRISVQEVEELLGKTDDTYELLAKKVASETAHAIEGLGITGIYAASVPERFYPLGERAAHILGFVGPDAEALSERGHYGVEEMYENTLRGVPGALAGGAVTAPQAGSPITLTLDPYIQIESERILRDLVERYHALGGTVIVEEPKTGKILSMVSAPAFDPNAYGASPLERFVNPAAQHRYEPGSVFKVFTMAAGIDAGKITPETAFVDTGSLVVSGKRIQNWDKKAYGNVTMANVLERSINTGAAFAERETGHAVFAEYLRKFGLHEKTGIDLPAEAHGDLRALHAKAPEIAYATASFGQGVAVTPIALINAVSAIANNGSLMRPYVNVELDALEVRRVLRPETVRAVTDMMVSAVSKAEVAKISGYSLAGKTGTAQLPDFTSGGYREAFIHTYVGFGPASNPRFAILIKLDEPEGAPLAGITVVPAFRTLAQFLLNYYEIPPDQL